MRISHHPYRSHQCVHQRRSACRAGSKLPYRSVCSSIHLGQRTIRLPRLVGPGRAVHTDKSQTSQLKRDSDKQPFQRNENENNMLSKKTPFVLESKWKTCFAIVLWTTEQRFSGGVSLKSSKRLRTDSDSTLQLHLRQREAQGKSGIRIRCHVHKPELAFLRTSGDDALIPALDGVTA